MAVTAHHMPRRVIGSARGRRSGHAETWATQLRWFAAAAVVSFAVPFVFSSLLGLEHDVYLGIYFAVVLSGFALYARATELDVGDMLRRHWKLGCGLSLVFGAALVQNVLSDRATPHPHGSYYVFELIWRGGIYGAVDALLLTVLPCLVALRSFGRHLGTWRRRVAYFCTSLLLVVTITGIYHLGFTQYRHDGIGAPETGNVLISMPMLLTTNPIGSIADHMAMHISAVSHTYDTKLRLPPAANARQAQP